MLWGAPPLFFPQKRMIWVSRCKRKGAESQREEEESLSNYRSIFLGCFLFVASELREGPGGWLQVCLLASCASYFACICTLAWANSWTCVLLVLCKIETCKELQAGLGYRGLVEFLPGPKWWKIADYTRPRVLGHITRFHLVIVMGR